MREGVDTLACERGGAVLPGCHPHTAALHGAQGMWSCAEGHSAVKWCTVWWRGTGERKGEKGGSFCWDAIITLRRCMAHRVGGVVQRGTVRWRGRGAVGASVAAGRGGGSQLFLHVLPSLPCSRLLRRLKSFSFLPSSRVQDEVLRARLLQAEQATTNDCCLCVPCSLPSPPFPLTLATLLSPPRPSSRVQDEVLRARVLQAEGEAAAGRSAEGNEERVGAMKGQAEQMERRKGGLLCCV
ncbi:unnamed protein product [Closterium sp. NIES-64]|nr:unnamed protein product [Closterium sp. NIES-64]